MRKSSKCEYTIGVNTRKKKRFLRPEEAIDEAERLNELPNIIKKFIAYKCTTCLFFHVGRSTEDNKKPINKESIFVQEIKIEYITEPNPIKITEPETKPSHDDFDWDNKKNKYI